MKKVIIIGASGHGKVIADIIEKSGDYIEGYLDDDPNSVENFGYPVLGKIDDYMFYHNDYFFIIAIGDNRIRKLLSEKMIDVHWYTAIHPSAIIAKDVYIGEGTAIMANAVLNASSTVGKHAIINTAAVVEHDNVIENFVHLSPRVALGGTVHIGRRSHIGIGAVVKNNICICSDVVVGAGGCVVKNIISPGVYVGIPVEPL